jgi:hypothetical protein
MKFKQMNNGVLLPEVVEPPKVEREYGRLELTDDETRKELGLALTKLLNSLEHKMGGITMGILTNNMIRKEIVLQFAYTMLGNDFEYEVKC